MRTRREIINAALAHMKGLLGMAYSKTYRYRWYPGGSTDCSGYVYAAYLAAGHPLLMDGAERMTSMYEVYADGFELLWPESEKAIGKSFAANGFWKVFDFQPGDLIFYNFDADTARSNKITHVAMCLDRDNIIHTANPRDNAVIAPISYGDGRIVAVTRLKADAEEMRRDELKKGSADRVQTRRLQALLNSFGARLECDGLWGTKTEAALEAFQSTACVTERGACGAETWAALCGERGETAEKPKEDETMELTRNLKQGMSGQDVKELQQLLDAKGYSAGAADGIFGSKTDAAVRAFQRAQGLAADGIVGPKTWTRLTEGVQSTEPAASAYPFTRNLKKSMSGGDVEELQRLLNAQGFNAGKEDGIFGSRTYEAVRAAQKRHHLTVDGIAGKHTIAALGGMWGYTPAFLGDTLTICTFNIKRGTYKNGTHKIIGGIIKDADIAGIQEVTPSGLAGIAEHAGKSSHMCETISGYGHAVLTNFRADSERITTLPGSGERRKVHHLQFGDVSFYNTHFHYTDSSSTQQLDALADMLKKDMSKTIIVTGDFNRQTFGAITAAGFTQANTGQAIAATEGGASIVNKIDNIFVKGARITDIWKYEAVSKGYSDHDALFVKLKR